MNGKKSDPIPMDNPEGGGANYLYHRQKASPRHRTRAPGYKTGPIKLQTMTARALMIRHTLVFLGTAACMFGLLVLAIHIYDKNWGLKQAQAWNRGGKTPPPLPVAANGGESVGGPLDALFLTPATNALSVATIRNYSQAFPVMRYALFPWRVMGQILMARGNYELARQAFQLALAGEPETAALYNDLGVCAWQLGHLPEARRSFQVALRLDQAFAHAYFNLALLALAGKDKQAARSYLAQYLALRPGDVVALQEWASLQAASGNNAAALQTIEKALALQPDSGPLALNAAVLAALLARDQQTCAHLRTAIENNPITVMYKAYQQPVFRNIRLTEEGKELEKLMAQKAREALMTPQALTPLTIPSKPRVSE